MNLVVIHRNEPPPPNVSVGGQLGGLRFAVSSEPVASVIFDGLSRDLRWDRDSELSFAVPEEWNVRPSRTAPEIIPYREGVPIPPEFLRKIIRQRTLERWFVVSDGRFATQVNLKLLEEVLNAIDADVTAVNIEPELLAGCEKVRLTTRSDVAGIRRLYADSAELSPPAADWPHHTFIKTEAVNRLLMEHTLPQSFPDFSERCRAKALTLRTIRIGGLMLDLETEEGLLDFCRNKVGLLPPRHLRQKNRVGKNVSSDDSTASEGARILGKVLLGENVEIGAKVVIIGPTIIGNNVKVGQGAVINSAIVGPEVCVPQEQLVDNCIITEPHREWSRLTEFRTDNSNRLYISTFDLDQQSHRKDFRTWPRFSYPGFFKRIADCFVAIIVLTLFAPIVPFIALAIKLTSAGPILFKDRRQGLHGKSFNCLKFRTMLVGADKIQDKLRVVSQVDGPQFKMKDDPRLNTVGRFLRDTFIDEIPQFFNVLLGQMSVIGPRPSPEAENTLCPSWRDARLSVRPGITGLWQVRRTRRPMKDFQEWIYYDTLYVKNLSLKTDLWICWQTAKKMIRDFVHQFY